MPDFTTLIGYVACLASISAFVPQLWKVVKTRDTKGLSTSMWVFEVITFSLWTVYGIEKGELPIVVTNIACGLMSIAILSMKLVTK